MSKKICPLFMAGALANSSRVPQSEANEAVATLSKLIACREDGCEFWTQAHLAEPERGTEYGCAIRINAMTNSEGRVVC